MVEIDCSRLSVGRCRASIVWRRGQRGRCSEAGRRTLVGEDDGLSVALTHRELQRQWPPNYLDGSKGISGGWSVVTGRRRASER